MRRFAKNLAVSGAVLVVLALLCSASGTAYGVTINFSFNEGGNYIGTDPDCGEYYQGLGAAPDDAANTYWNNIWHSGSNPYTYSSLKLSDNTATGIALQVTAHAYNQNSSEGMNLMDGGIHPYDGNNAQLVLSGLSDSETYTLYVYGGRRGSTDTTYVINGSEYVIPTTELRDSFLEVSGSNGGNYFAVSNLYSSMGVLSFEIKNVDGSPSMVGFQLTGGTGGGSTIPEPSTVALLATGLLGLLAYAWKKRK